MHVAFVRKIHLFIAFIAFFKGIFTAFFHFEAIMAHVGKNRKESCKPWNHCGSPPLRVFLSLDTFSF